jgi:uncharacterized protein
MKRPFVFAALLAGALLAGCASEPTRFYTLALPVQLQAGGTASAASVLPAPLIIEFAPLGVPDQLARPQFVVRHAGADASAKVEVLEDYRWSSSFDLELRDALANGVAQRLGAVNTTLSGRATGQQAWRISLQVHGFDAIQDQRVDMSLTWSMQRTDGGASSTCEWSASEPVASGIDALAQGAQRLTARAADAIAGHVAALQARKTPDCKAAG